MLKSFGSTLIFYGVAGNDECYEPDNLAREAFNRIEARLRGDCDLTQVELKLFVCFFSETMEEWDQGFHPFERFSVCAASPAHELSSVRDRLSTLKSQPQSLRVGIPREPQS